MRKCACMRVRPGWLSQALAKGFATITLNEIAGMGAWARGRLCPCRRLIFIGEFDPGSGRTLAACLRNASRTGTLLREGVSGERSRNT